MLTDSLNSVYRLPLTSSYQRVFPTHNFNIDMSVGTDPKAYFLTAREQEIILKWFPYSHNPIVGDRRGSGKPAWVTWKKITDATKLEIFADPQRLVGVGFDQQTRYALIDIDRTSPYHPANNKAAFDRLLEALESFGMTGYQILQSSDSGGIHIYCPFGDALKSFGLAASLKSHVQANGFEVKDGVLEIFPNQKAKEAQYKKHRLPLQPESGSILLDSSLEPLEDQSLEEFDRRMEWAIAKTDLTTIKASLSYYFKVAKGLIKPTMSPAAIAYMEGLQVDLNGGWNDDAQTNRILGRIAQYHYVFRGLEDLETLTQAVYETAINAKGYQDYCDHRVEGHEPKKIWDRCREWSKSIINSDRYYVYGSRRNLPQNTPLTAPQTISKPQKGLTPWEKANDALERQIRALEEAIAAGLNFDYPTHLKNWLVQKAGSSLQTITKNWEKLAAFVEKLIKPAQKSSEANQNKGFSLHPRVMLETLKMMCNPAQGKASSDFKSLDKLNPMMCNPAQGKASSDFKDDCIKLSFVIHDEPDFSEASDLPLAKPETQRLEISENLNSSLLTFEQTISTEDWSSSHKLKNLVLYGGKPINPFLDEEPVPLPPKFYWEFCSFLTEVQRDYGESLLDVHYSAIPALMAEIELEHHRINYPYPWGVVGLDLFRLDVQRLWLWLQLVRGLPTVAESIERPCLEQSDITPEEICDCKRLRKRRGWLKYQQMLGKS